jgi:hypothetical protein
MVIESEITTLVLAFGALLFILSYRGMMGNAARPKVLLVAYLFAFGAWLLTVLEGLWWGQILNLLEHVCYATSSILIGYWCWQVFFRAPVAEQ